MKKEKKVIKAEVIKEKKVIVPRYELISFGIKATIPTQMYGNIMPEIIVKAETIEDAKAIVMPAIEAIYGAYSEKPRDGSNLSFLNKSSVTVVEKKVGVIPNSSTLGGLGSVSPTPSLIPSNTTPPLSASGKVQALADELNPKSAAYEKAFGAIKNTMSLEALNLIEDQIQKSVKLSTDEKPILLTEVLKKRKEFN